MPCQLGFKGKSFITKLTLVHGRFQVNSLREFMNGGSVVFQMISLHERLIAQIALKTPRILMSQGMLLQRTFLRKLFSANFTLEIFRSRVDLEVDFQPRRVDESLSTIPTRPPFLEANFLFPMRLQPLQRVELFTAVFTLEFLLFVTLDV